MCEKQHRCAMGVDFGTTNSTVALYDGKTAISVEFPLDDGTTVPSAIYIDRDLRTVRVGRDAMDTYRRENEHRVVRLTRELLGDIQMYCADQAFTFNVFGMSDSNMPGRLLCSLKRWLGDGDLEGIDVFGRRFRIVTLVQLILQHLAAGAGMVDGERVYFGRPVHFGGSNRVAVGRLTEATGEAGFPDVRFYAEPVAAAVSYLRTRMPKPGTTFLCFDFGGGTLDLCVFEAVDEGFRIRSTHGIPLGGDLIDQLIFRRKLFPELGDLCPMTMRTIDGEQRDYRFHLLPFETYLLNWQISSRLNQPALLEELARGIQSGGDASVRLSRLYSLIRQNLSYTALKAIEAAKITLSDEEEADIQLPELDLRVRITRHEFETYLKAVLPRIDHAVHTTATRAGIPLTAIDEVVCTGGSSRIPAIRTHLAELIGRPTIEHESFTGVATGLAIANYHGYGEQQDG